MRYRAVAFRNLCPLFTPHCVKHEVCDKCPNTLGLLTPLILLSLVNSQMVYGSQKNIQREYGWNVEFFANFISVQ